MEVESGLKKLKFLVLDSLRRGNRQIIWPAPGLRFGNLLYMWMQADLRQQSGVRAEVLDVEAGHPWLAKFPKIEDSLVIRRSDVPFLAQRVMGTFQEFGNHFSREQLDQFCRTYLLSSRGIQDYISDAERAGVQDPRSISVNVRRGDYYSVVENRENYGFDIVGYVKEALGWHMSRRQVGSVHLISDDINWCVSNLGPVMDELSISYRFSPDPDGMRDFAFLALSNRLILANSSFSYWGGYLAGARSSTAEIVAPRFHARAWNGGRAYQLDPAWHAVDGYCADVPSG